MKRILTLVFSLFSTWASAQTEWKQLEQPSIRLRYALPHGWYVGGFKSEAKCNCTGAAINTSNSGSLNMVIFYSNKENIDSLSRQSVWGYSFDTNNAQSMRGNSDAEFSISQQLSSWKEDPSLRVLRLKVQAHEHSYLVYFWGTAAALEKESSDIQKIVQSIEVYTP